MAAASSSRRLACLRAALAACNNTISPLVSSKPNSFSHPNPSNVSLSVSTLSVGYNRDFAQSYLGSYYGSDRGYLKFAFFFGGRALLSLEGGAGAREYPQIFSNAGGMLTAIGPAKGF